MDNVSGIIGRELMLTECEFSRPYNGNPLTPMVFNGWSLNANGSGKRYADQETIAADDPNFTEEKTYTLYAQWKNPDYYIVKFNGNGGSGTMTNQFATLTADYPVPNAKFFNFKHYFTGWRADDPETGTFYAKGSSIPANTYNTPTQVVTLYAQWEEGEAPPETTNVEIPFELKAGQQATIDDLPAGTGYQVWEETPTGWVLQYEVNQTGSIVSKTAATSYYKNRYDPQSTSVSITATKLLDGRVPGQSFSFTLKQFSGPEGSSLTPITVDSTDVGAISFGTIQYSEGESNGVGTYVYHITETPGGDSSISYDSHTEEVTVTVAKADGIMTANVVYDTDGAVFENTHKPGNLQVKKIVEDGEGNGNDDLEFSYTLSLRDATGALLDNTKTFDYTKYYADASEAEMGTIGNGGSFTLKAGQYLVVSNLEYGTKYNVEEINLPGGWSIESAENSNGTVPAGGTAEASFKNVYTPGSRGGGPGGTQVTLMAHKLLEGETLQSGQFSFLLEKWNSGTSTWDTVEQVQNGEIDTAEEILNSAGETISNPWYGTGPVRFSELSFAGADEAFYRVTESAASPADARINYASDAFYAKVTVTDDGDGGLNTNVVWYSAWNANTNVPENPIQTTEPEFVNSVKTWPLKISKVLRNAPTGTENTEFSFTLTLKKADGSALILSEPLPAGLTAGADGSYTFTLKGGDSLTVPDLPYGVSFSVTEAAQEGFAMVGKQGDTGTIGQIPSGAQEVPTEYSAVFTNSGYTAASAQVPIVKFYRGADIEDSGENRFLIHVEEFADENRSVPTNSFDYAVPAAAANANGDATSRFQLPLSYSYSVLAGAESKTLYYRFTEVRGASGNILYSTASYTGKTVITNEGGGVISAQFSFDGGIREASFNNYRLLELNIDKTVAGNLADLNKPFNFTVQLSNLPDPADYPDLVWTGMIQADSNMGTAIENTWNFTLKNGESTKVLKVPYGTSTLVREDPEEYKAGLTVQKQNADGTWTEIDSRSGDRAASRSAVLTENQYLHFTNTKQESVPTGVKVAAGGGVLAAVGLAGYAGLKLKRRKEREEE